MWFKSETVRKLSAAQREVTGMRDQEWVFVDTVYAFCEKHYAAGGDYIVERFDPIEVAADFPSLAAVKGYLLHCVSAELEARPGNDDDPQLARYAAAEKAFGQPDLWGREFHPLAEAIVERLFGRFGCLPEAELHLVIYPDSAPEAVHKKRDLLVAISEIVEQAKTPA